MRSAGRDFSAAGPNTKYICDITYLPVWDGEFLYLATVLGCFSRRMVGWSIADHMHQPGCRRDAPGSCHPWQPHWSRLPLRSWRSVPLA